MSVCYGMTFFLTLFGFTSFQIRNHYNHRPNQKCEMGLDKLQLIATTNVKGMYKVRWLKMWNGSDNTRAANSFPRTSCSESQLHAWLHKACFYALLEDEITEKIEPILLEYPLPDWTKEVKSWQVYLNYWKKKVWQKAFPTVFAGKHAFQRNDTWNQVPKGNLIVSRFIYR